MNKYTIFLLKAGKINPDPMERVFLPNSLSASPKIRWLQNHSRQNAAQNQHAEGGAQELQPDYGGESDAGRAGRGAGNVRVGD